MATSATKVPLWFDPTIAVGWQLLKEGGLRVEEIPPHLFYPRWPRNQREEAHAASLPCRTCHGAGRVEHGLPCKRCLGTGVKLGIPRLKAEGLLGDPEQARAVIKDFGPSGVVVRLLLTEGEEVSAGKGRATRWQTIWRRMKPPRYEKSDPERVTRQRDGRLRAGMALGVFLERQKARLSGAVYLAESVVAEAIPDLGPALLHPTFKVSGEGDAPDLHPVNEGSMPFVHRLGREGAAIASQLVLETVEATRLPEERPKK